MKSFFKKAAEIANKVVQAAKAAEEILDKKKEHAGAFKKAAGKSGPPFSLLDAVTKNNVVAATAFLDLGADPNEKTEDIFPLAQAVDNGNIEMVRLLLSRGARPEEETDTHVPLQDALHPERYLEGTPEKTEIPRLLIKATKSLAVIREARAMAIAFHVDEKLQQMLNDAEVQLSGLPAVSFKGKTFVFTGKFSTMLRHTGMETVESLGGKVSNTISKHTDYLVVGSGAGSKLAKAKSLGVTILSEDKWNEMLEHAKNRSRTSPKLKK